MAHPPGVNPRSAAKRGFWPVCPKLGRCGLFSAQSAAWRCPLGLIETAQWHKEGMDEDMPILGMAWCGMSSCLMAEQWQIQQRGETGHA